MLFWGVGIGLGKKYRQKNFVAKKENKQTIYVIMCTLAV